MRPAAVILGERCATWSTRNSSAGWPGSSIRGERGGAARRPQGRREGVAARLAGGRDVPDASSGGARRAAHQRAHHHRFLRGADRAGHAAVSARAGSCCSICATSISSSTGISATKCCGRPACPARSHGDDEHPARAVRHLQCRADEDRLPPRPRHALRAHHAGHLGRAFQLLVSRRSCGTRSQHVNESKLAAAGLRVRAIFRRAAQLPALRLAGPVSVRHLARRVEELLRRTRDRPARRSTPTPSTSRTAPRCA